MSLVPNIGKKLQSPQSDLTPWTLTLPYVVRSSQQQNLGLSDGNLICGEMSDQHSKQKKLVGSQTPCLSALDFWNSPVWIIEFHELDFKSISNLNFTGRKIKFKLGKKSSWYDLIFQIGELQKSSADRLGESYSLEKLHFLETYWKQCAYVAM